MCYFCPDAAGSHIGVVGLGERHNEVMNRRATTGGVELTVSYCSGINTKENVISDRACDSQCKNCHANRRNADPERA